MGINTTAYTTAANAADINDLRLALGYSQWNLYGVSYDTRLALTILRDHPEGVRSAILDAVYPPMADKYTELAANAEVNPRFWKAINNIAAPEMCAGWDVAPISPIEDQPVFSDIPVLILTGDNDPITTNTWARMAAETLSMSQYIEFPGFGHGVLQSGLDNQVCQKTIVDTFIEDPEARIDGSCLTELMPYFVVAD